MADIGYIAIVVAGVGAYCWRFLRLRARGASPRDLFLPDAEVALHVALHEATSRRQPLSSLHVLYGLLQDEAVVAAIATAGGDPDTLEDRVLAALAAPSDDEDHDEDHGEDHDEDHGDRIAGRAAAVAQHGNRRASCTDLWAGLAGSRAARLLDDARLDRGATLFALFHGGRPSDLTLPHGHDVLVVLRNDHYTTQEFVCGVLRDVFAVPQAQATEIMLAAHATGRAVIGRFSAADARARITAARERARGQAFPLWIGVEPA